MDLPKLAEEKVRKAIDRGEFENLGGAGRKIDLSEFFNTPAEYRIGYSLLKSNRFLPGEVELMREIGELREAVADAQLSERAGLVKRLNEMEIALAIILERNLSGSRRS